jgi:alpha-methylacyl-CoA racemase
LGLDKVRWLPLGFPAVDEKAREQWPELRAVLEEAFSSRTQAEWCELLEGSDTCFAPVLSMSEALHHPHNVERGAFIEVDGITQNAPVPRFSQTLPDQVRGPRRPGADTQQVLINAGYSAVDIDSFRDDGALG